MFRALSMLTLWLAFSSLVNAQSSPDIVAQYSTMPAIHELREVPRSLSLNENQMIRLNALIGNLQGSYREYYTPVWMLPEADRRSKLDILNRYNRPNGIVGAEDVLTGREVTRYRDLHLALGGFRSLLDIDMQRRLNLDEEQRKRIRENWDWSVKQVREIDRAATIDPRSADRLYSEYRKGYEDRIAKLLTLDQERVWRNLTGEQYDISRDTSRTETLRTTRR